MPFLFADNTLEWVYRSEGVFFYPQLVLAVLTLTLAISASDMMRKRVMMPKRLRSKLALLVKEGQLDEALALLHCDSSPLSDVVRSGFAALARSQNVEAARSEVAMACEEVDISMERRLDYLATLAHVATMVGLLGTVWGLVRSFMVISQHNQAPQPRDLAEGVSQALVTTIFGLLTAIPAVLIRGYLQHAASAILHALEQTALSLVGELGQKREKTAQSPSQNNSEVANATAKT